MVIMNSCYGKDVAEMQSLELCHEFYSTYEFEEFSDDVGTISAGWLDEKVLMFALKEFGSDEPFCRLGLLTMGTPDDEAGSSRSKCSRQNETVEELLPRHISSSCVVNWDLLNIMGCDGEIDEMLRIRLQLFHEFYSTYEFDEVCVDDELQTKKIIKFRLGGRAQSLTLLEFARRLGLYQTIELKEEGFNVYFEGGLRSDEHFNAGLLRTTGFDKIQKNDLWLLSMFDARHQNRVVTEDVVRSLSAPIYCRDLDTITLRDLIDSEGKLIPEDPQPGVPRVGISRPPRASMQDLYDRMEIRQEAI
ncbi:hypothetical protein Tco_0413786 [Tanacetum coccineum]